MPRTLPPLPFVFTPTHPQSTVMALLIGAFASAKTSVTLMDGVMLLGIIYFSLMYMILDSVPVVAITYERKRVFLKQRDNYFFPAWAFSWPLVRCTLTGSS